LFFFWVIGNVLARTQLGMCKTVTFIYLYQTAEKISWQVCEGNSSLGSRIVFWFQQIVLKSFNRLSMISVKKKSTAHYFPAFQGKVGVVSEFVFSVFFVLSVETHVKKFQAAR
jgi:hypothetical protein